MKPEATKYFLSGGLLVVIGLFFMSLIGPTLINGGCTGLGVIELIYATYLSIK